MPLRAAGILTARCAGRYVLDARTALGDQLLDGALDVGGGWPSRRKPPRRVVSG